MAPHRRPNQYLSILTLNDPNPNFKVTPLFNAEYLRNGARYRHSYNELVALLYNRDLYALLKRVILNYLE